MGTIVSKLYEKDSICNVYVLIPKRFSSNKPLNLLPKIFSVLFILTLTYPKSVIIFLTSQTLEKVSEEIQDSVQFSTIESRSGVKLIIGVDDWFIESVNVKEILKGSSIFKSVIELTLILLINGSEVNAEK